MHGSMNIEFFNRCYAYLLLIGAAFLIGIFLLNFKQPYMVWQNWAHPDYSINTYPILFLSYFLDIATPVAMLLVGSKILKQETIKWFLLLTLGVLLFFSKLIGLAYLLIGVCLYAANWVSVLEVRNNNNQKLASGFRLLLRSSPLYWALKVNK